MLGKIAVAALAVGLFDSGARADTKASYRCDDGKQFTVTFHDANNMALADLVFAGSTNPVVLKNQMRASGIKYAGGGWTLQEWHGATTLTEAPSGKDVACKVLK